MMRIELIRQKIGLYVSGSLSPTKNHLNLVQLFLLLSICLIIQLALNRCPFVTPKHGTEDSRCITTHPARAEVKEKSSKVDVTVAAPCNTGATDVRSTQNLKPTSSQKQNDFIKDEYFHISNSFSSEFNIDSHDIDKHSFTENYFEYEQGESCILVKGRLKKHIQFWKDIGTNNFILDVIQNGYKIPFFTTPPSVCLYNNQSAMKESEFVVEAINDLVIKGLVVECTDKPFVVNPLTVSVQNSGKKRLILDLRHVNLHLWKTTVKFEDIRTAMQFIDTGSYCFKYDVHSAYHHIDIFEPHTEFLGFSWKFGDHIKYFKFLVLPFGLSSACYIFTKVTRPLIKKWRSEGKHILMYLDDGLGTDVNYEQCKIMSDQVKNDLILSGFVPKPEKSVWIPVKQITFLGYCIDTEKGMLYIPQDRMYKAFATISDIETSLEYSNTVPVRKLASFVGQIISMSYVIRNVAYIMTKYLSMNILSARNWYSDIILTDLSIDQINFWKSNLREINHKLFDSDLHCYTVIYSDASSTGYGGYIVENPNSIAHGMWSESEKLNSSTWKELTAVKNVLMSLIDFVKGKKIKWFTDNQNIVHIINKGSMKSHLQDIAYIVYKLCFKFSICIEVEWIPRTLNEKADYISRIVDHDDWAVSFDIFAYLDSLWGPHEIDMFANDDNHKLPVFYSRYWNVKSIGIDAFTIDWRGINGWFVPPVCLLLKVFKYMKQCNAYGTVILPVWKSASFWPFICPNGDGFIREVVQVLDLPTNKSSFYPGKGNKSVFGNIDLPFRVIALRVDFRKSINI